MEKHRAIPQEYMTVGQIAKKMGVTVRTLQYYDKEGVMSPSAQSEGGRRLYTDKDMVKLHQILSMKYLGFSLDDIKTRLISLDTPADVANALTEHAAAIRQKMEALSESLQAIEALKAEVMQIQVVDFGKYADIIVNLQMKNEMYWVIKYFDNDLLDYFRGRFDKESGKAMMERLTNLFNEAEQLKEGGTSPESERGQGFAKAFWDMIMEFAGGDMSVLSRFLKVADMAGEDGSRWEKRLMATNDFIRPALEAYFAKLGYDPFKPEK